jgi:hypothetical protein
MRSTRSGVRRGVPVDGALKTAGDSFDAAPGAAAVAVATGAGVVN